VHEQGLLVLGRPIGSETFVQLELRRSVELQDQLLTRLPTVGDLQGAWLPLLYCASPREKIQKQEDNACFGCRRLERRNIGSAAPFRH